MTNASRAVAFVTASVCLLSAHAAYSESSSEERAASVLSLSFETVVKARLDYVLSINDDATPASSELSLRLPYVTLMGGLSGLDPSTLRVVAASYNTVLVGDKDFTPPVGIGMVSAHECYVGILQGVSRPDLSVAFRKASYTNVGGRRAWTWSLPPYEGYPKPTEFYAAQVGLAYFVMSNNLQDFEAVAAALTSLKSVDSRAFNEPGWNTLSAHEYWAVRKIRRSDATITGAAGIEDLAPETSGFAFYADPKGKQCTVQVFSSDKSMNRIPDAAISTGQGALKATKPGVWQTTFSLSDQEEEKDAMDRVFYRFGFGAVL